MYTPRPKIYFEYYDSYDGSYRLYPLSKEKYGDQPEKLLELDYGEVGELHNYTPAPEVPVNKNITVGKPKLTEIYIVREE